MFGRKPFSAPEFTPLLEEQARELFEEEKRKAAIHFGEGRMNPSTIAGIFALVEERVTRRPVVAASHSAETRYFLETIGWVKPRRATESTDSNS